MSTKQHSPTSQRGFATLVVILMLLLALTTVTLTASRSSKIEQLITGNELRAQEIQGAAEATLDFAIAWGSQNPLPWANVSDAVIDCGNDSGCPTLPGSITASDSGTFNLHIKYQRNPSKPNWVKVTATATQTDNDTSSTITCYIDQQGSIVPGTWKDF